MQENPQKKYISQETKDLINKLLLEKIPLERCYLALYSSLQLILICFGLPLLMSLSLGDLIFLLYRNTKVGCTIVTSNLMKSFYPENGHTQLPIGLVISQRIGRAGKLQYQHYKV